MSRRRLSFPGVTENAATDGGNTCSLCLASHTQISVPATWKNTKAREIAFSDLKLTHQSPVCRLCRDDIGRLSKDPDIRPRWEKTKTEQKCCANMCTNICFSILSVGTREQIAHILKCESIPYPAPLCQRHYHFVYDMLQSKYTHCCTCNSTLRNVRKRVCPNPKVIQQYLVQNTAFEGTIPQDGRVCPSCYKAHLIILKKQSTSLDNDLRSLINEIKAQSTDTLRNEDDVINLAMQNTAVYVGEKLLQQECLLLPSVTQVFSSFVSKAAHASHLRIEEKVTARCLLSNLIICLQHHMSYTCCIKKHGTILYRSNGDLLTSISHLLHKSRHDTNNTSESTVSSIACTCTCTNMHPSQEPASLKSTLDNLNTRLHQQIQRFLAADLNAPYPVDALDIKSLVAQMDPQLWTFIRSITRSISERKGYIAKTNQPDTEQHHVKQVRCLFCLCVLMFCTDDRCSVPFHTLITDTIESYGGSSQLIRILNRLGVCSSADTLARLIQFRVKERERNGPEEECWCYAPTIISTDNIDFQHSYARVFCGKQTSSWHGTTVQAVQPRLNPPYHHDSHNPMPVHRIDEALPERSSATHGYRHLECAASEKSVAQIARKRSFTTRSPYKPLRSPIPKVKRRARTGMEENAMVPSTSLVHFPVSDSSTCNFRENTLDTQIMYLNPNERLAITEFRKEMDTYMLLNYTHSKDGTVAADAPILSIQDYMTVISPYTAQKSNIVYMQVLDAKSESKDTLMTIMFDLHQRFIDKQGKKFLVLVADAKLYEVLQSLKYEYGEELNWVLLFPGDWHMLKNFQIALMKPYFDMGLKELAHVSGYPVASIQACSQFKRTHHFLIEAWQALYLVMLQRFIEATTEQGDSSQDLTYFIQSASLHIKSSDFLARVTQLRETLQESTYHTNFHAFLDEMASTDINWKFWMQFVFEDMLAYICLYLAIRSGCWELRLASIKLMAPIFTAFDHQNYRKLIAQHLADLHTFPTEVLSVFKEGGFVASLSGRQWHSVALDEAHEMKINKECKTSIVHPSRDYITRVAGYIPYRAKCMENLREQLFPEEHCACTMQLPTSILCQEPNAKKTLANTEAQRCLVLSSEHLQTRSSNQKLCNPFTKKIATSEQQHDLLHFRNIGQKEFERHVAYYILKEASVHPPLRKKRLLTLSQRKATRRQITQLEKDRKVIQKCLHKKLKWSKLKGQPIDKIAEQYVPIPLALAESSGTLIKGQKSNTTKSLKARYKDATPQVFINKIPEMWVAECVVVEGMFMLNITPLGSHRTFADYASFLAKRFLMPHFAKGAKEVHLIFDNPGRLAETPKHFERARRDTLARVIVGHVCDEVTESRVIPSKWREDVINCRNCKRNVVIFLGKYYMRHLPKQIQPEKRLILAGCFEGDIQDTAWLIARDYTPEPCPEYTSNAEETDTRIWLHFRQTQCSKILILSPDTDIYHIGLPMNHGQKDIMIRISTYNSRDLCFLHLPALITALQNDPDLSSIEPTLLPQIFQSLFVITGCDYISFFSGIGKATFLRYFYQHSQFITSGQATAPGTLANISSDHESGFMAFLRLVGVVYMKKHGSGFNGKSPEAYYNQFTTPGQTALQHHNLWLDNIRQCIWDRIIYENDMIPNTDALYRHWKRACWVLDFWKQACTNTITPKPMTNYGWKLIEGTLSVEWDSESNMDAVRERVAGLLKGCGCRTGCQTRQCGCRSKEKACGEGCNCMNCTNTELTNSTSSTEVASLEEIMEDTIPDNMDELMEWVFGENEAETVYEEESEGYCEH